MKKNWRARVKCVAGVLLPLDPMKLSRARWFPGQTLVAVICTQLSVGACGDNVGTWGKADGGVARVGTWIFQTGGNHMLDILFVVDDTPDAAAQATPALLARILRPLHELPAPGLSLHVAAASGSAPADGSGCAPAGARGDRCGLDPSYDYVRVSPCHAPNFSGDPWTTFDCLSDLGHGGCGPGQPLAAAVRVLGGGGGLAGYRTFLRDRAHLAVIILAATDDASGAPGPLTAVSELVASARSLKSDPDRILVSVMAPTPACANTRVAPSGAPRLKAFADAFGANAVFISACADPAQLVGRLVSMSVDNAPSCLHDLEDSNPEQPGLQPDCAVWNRTYDFESGSATEGLVRPCDGVTRPCWRLEPNPSCRPSPDGLELGFDLASDACPASTRFETKISCALD